MDKIADQQNTINALEGKINDKLMTGGSYVILPKDTNIKTTNEEIKCIYPKNQADANMIRVVTAQANTEADMYHMAEVYEEARQVLGITDSYQGRKDTTATSGKAKEFAANMSAGRLQSKRIMKNAAYAQLFELCSNSNWPMPTKNGRWSLRTNKTRPNMKYLTAMIF